MVETYDVDVVVVGGGIAGAFCALTLHNHGLAVVLVEKENYQRPRAGEHMAPECEHLLKKLDIHLPLELYRLCNSLQSVWGNAPESVFHYIANSFGPSKALERPAFDQYICQVALDRGIKVYVNSSYKLHYSIRGIESILLEGENNRNIEFVPQFFVDATGRQSTLSKKLGAKQLLQDKMLGIAKTLPGWLDHDVVIESTADGWFYGINMLETAGRCQHFNAVYFTDYDKNLSGCDLQKLFDKAYITLKKFPPSIINQLDVPAQFYLAASFQLSKIINKNCIAVGDAAYTFDPISSSGIYKAMDDGIGCADAIIRQYMDPQSIKLYQSFCRKRYAEYLKNRHYYYQFAKQSSQSSFWLSRSTLQRNLWLSPDADLEFRITSSSLGNASIRHNPYWSKIQSTLIALGHKNISSGNLAKAIQELNFPTLRGENIISFIQALIEDGVVLEG